MENFKKTRICLSDTVKQKQFLIATIASSALLLLTCTLPVTSQVPQGFNYQAVARNSEGYPLASEDIQIRITLLSDTLLNTVVWQELHGPLRTTPQGLFSLAIGSGTREEASAVDNFSEIDWTGPHLYLMTSIFHDNVWSEMGEARMWSVPYSMTSGNISGPIPNLQVAGKTLSAEEALFEVRNTSGQTVFAVYNEGVRVYVGDGLGKTSKGGFAIGSFDESKVLKDLLVVNSDCVRVYIEEENLKATKGGFAIGSFDETKQIARDFLKVTGDSIRMYVNDDPAKTSKGGFAIGSFDESKEIVNSFTSLTPDNYFIGHKAGYNNTTGLRNSVLGYESAVNNTEGSSNVFIGYQSGYSNELGMNNIFIGSRAGYSNVGAIQTDPFFISYGSENVFIGNEAGFSNISGWTNLFLGNGAGYGNINGTDNTYLGNFSGQGNIDGWGNVLVGAFSGRQNTNGILNFFAGFYSGNLNQGDENTFIGSYSGEENMNGDGNTIIGTSAGRLSTGSYNVFIGTGAGYNEAGNDKLYIENSQGTVPLIGGDFAANRVGINRLPTTYTLEVGGTIWANGSAITGGLTTWSDARYKKDIDPLKDPLKKVLQLNGVSYNWRTEDYPELNFSTGRQIGVIAQEVETILPELVFTGPDGFKSVSYEKFVPVLIEAMKEQQRIIESQQQQLDRIMKELESLKEILLLKAIKQN